MTPPARCRVVINGDDVYEDLFAAGDHLLQLASAAGFATTLHSGTAAFTSLATDPDAPTLVVLYTGMGEFTPAAQRGLADLVASGTGLVVVHGSNVFGMTDDGGLDPDYTIAFELMGSRFFSHGPLPHESEFLVHTDPSHPITCGIPEFAVVHERNYHELSDPPPRIIAWRAAENGPQPIVHVRDHGTGRVAFIHLGHDQRTIGHPGATELTRRSMLWAAHQPVAEA